MMPPGPEIRDGSAPPWLTYRPDWEELDRALFAPGSIGIDFLPQAAGRKRPVTILKQPLTPLLPKDSYLSAFLRQELAVETLHDLMSLDQAALPEPMEGDVTDLLSRHLLVTPQGRLLSFTFGEEQAVVPVSREPEVINTVDEVLVEISEGDEVAYLYLNLRFGLRDGVIRNDNEIDVPALLGRGYSHRWERRDIVNRALMALAASRFDHVKGCVAFGENSIARQRFDLVFRREVHRRLTRLSEVDLSHFSNTTLAELERYYLSAPRFVSDYLKHNLVGQPLTITALAEIEQEFSRIVAGE